MKQFLNILREPKNIFLFVKKCIKHPCLLFTKINEKKRSNIINNYAKKNKSNFFFIQIGAHDGISRDPIYKYVRKYNWQGILVEPQADIFKKLQLNYSDNNNLIFKNVVISDTTGYVDFYLSPNTKLSSLYSDEWFKGRNEGLSYFNRKKVGGSKIIKVKSITFSELLKNNYVKKINLLQIDTEGSDFLILKQIDFNRIKPNMINYEEAHLKKEERKKAKNLLKYHKYHIFKVGDDIFGYL